MASSDDVQLELLEGDELSKRLQINVAVRLGGGSSGRVFSAIFDGKPVAVKTLHPSAARREDVVGRFLSEAHLLARLNSG